MILFPNAKINIGLDIIARRPDGYHDIETVMVPTGWCDIIEILPAAEGHRSSLTVTGRQVQCDPSNNLVMKAVSALREVIPLLPETEIHLHKVIPDGAGLGGGSADAAFTLRGLNELYALGLDDHTLADIAATIGADCPFFIYNRPMLCYGTGTEMRPVDIDLTRWNLAIVKPATSVTTREAYSSVRPRKPTISLAESIMRPINEWNGIVNNDFETTVFPSHPEIGHIKSKLMQIGACYASMSGSGSAVYGLFDSDILSDCLKKEFPGCDIYSGPAGK